MYQNFTQTNNKKRLLISLSLASLLIVGCVLIFSNTSEKSTSEFLPKANPHSLSLFQMDSEAASQQTQHHVNYTLTVHTANTDTKSNYNEQGQMIYDVEAQLIQTYNEETGIISVQIIYEKVDQTLIDMQTDQPAKSSLINKKFVEGETEEQQSTIFYQADIIYITGEIISLQTIEDGNRLMNWITVSILKQQYPDLRQETYMANAKPQPVYDTLGEVEATFLQFDTEKQVVLHSQYDESNFKTFKYSIGGPMPKINYEKVSFMNKNTGRLEQGASSYSFQLNKKVNSVNSNDDSESSIELLGDVQTFIQTTIFSNDVALDEDLINAVNEFLNGKKLVEINLISDDGYIDFQVPEKQDSINLPWDDPIYRKDWNAFTKEIYGQNITVVVSYRYYGDESALNADLQVNGQVIYNIYNVSFQSCFTKELPGYSANIDRTLFSIVYPINGLVNVPVKTSISLDYGYKFTIGVDPQYKCKALVEPYFLPHLTSFGGVNVLEVLEGGAFSKGEIANTRFNLDVWYKGLTFGVDAIEHENPWDYEYGIYYWYIQCSLKRFDWKKFNWWSICQKTPETVKTLGHGSLISPRSKEIWSWEYDF